MMRQIATRDQDEALRSAVEKLAQLAAVAGLRIDDLIHLLESGMSPLEVTELVGSRLSKPVQ